MDGRFEVVVLRGFWECGLYIYVYIAWAKRKGGEGGEKREGRAAEVPFPRTGGPGSAQGAEAGGEKERGAGGLNQRVEGAVVRRRRSTVVGSGVE